MSEQESWSTAEVARMSGVTSRTLRHYDATGLLRPIGTGSGGIRRYGRTELVRLQQILVLRRLGLPLPDIAAALGGGDTTTVELLRDHRERLLAEVDRMRAVAATVATTIDHLEGGTAMDAAAMFEGFDPVRQAGYEQELVDRLGDRVVPHIEQSRTRVARMTRDDIAEVQRGFADIDRRLAELMADGAKPADQRVQEVLVAHHATVARFWTPDADAYAGLGDLYVDSPDFRDRYESVRPGLAEFLRDAMAVFAIERLA